MAKPKVMVVLGGALIKDIDANWRTADFNDAGDQFGISGDRLRVIAAHYLYQDDLNQLFIASGSGLAGQLQNISDAPHLSEVLKKELIALGIPAEKIIEERNSNDTYQQLQELKKIVQQEGYDDVTLVSNIYHLPRIEAMIEVDRELKAMFDSGRLKVTAAEDILMAYEPAVWQETIERGYNSQAMQARIKLEQQGIKDIKEGKYKFKQYED